MLHDDPLKSLPLVWAEAEMPAGLAERIMQRARTTPQQRPWWERFFIGLTRWDQAWNIKAPVLAAVLMLGLLGGQMSQNNLLEDMPAHLSWTEGL